MNKTSPSSANHLGELPLFPLSTILYPDGYLALQIFEMRYLSLIRDCFSKGLPFGVITLIKGQEVQNPKEQILLSPVGTQAIITEVFEETTSLLRVKIKGNQRFKLNCATQKKNGLWMGQVTMIENDQEVTVPEDLKYCSDLLLELISSFNNQNIPKDQLPIQPPHRLDNCGWISNRWCEVLPMNQAIKLQLLALENPLVRLELINDIIKIPVKKP